MLLAASHTRALSLAVTRCREFNWVLWSLAGVRSRVCAHWFAWNCLGARPQVADGCIWLGIYDQFNAATRTVVHYRRVLFQHWGVLIWVWIGNGGREHKTQECT